MNRKSIIQKTATITLLILALSMCLTTGTATALASYVASASPAQQSASNPPFEQAAPAQVYTDKADYHPGELVTIYGSGFLANTSVSFTVTKLKDNTTTNWSAGSDSQGNLTTTYQIDAEGAPLYKIEATDGTNSATNTFTDTSLTVTNTRNGISKNAGNTGDHLYAKVGDTLTATVNNPHSYDVEFMIDISSTGYDYFQPQALTSGSSVKSYTIPTGFPPSNSPAITNGEYIVAMWDDTVGWYDETDIVYITITTNGDPPPAQSIGLSSTSGNVGDTVTVTGSGFGNNQPFTVTYGSTTVASGTTTGTGTIPSGTTFTVPASASGAHTVTVTQGSNSATATYTVTSKITLSPSSGNVGDTVTLTATGMMGSHSDCTATFAGTSFLTLSSSTTDSNGGLTATFTVPASTSGSKSVVLSDGTNNPAATITVNPKITLAPSSGLTGGSVAVTGTGFGSSSTVTLTYDTVTQTTTPGTVTTSSSGGFSCSFTIPASTGGEHTVKATQGSNFATATYTVTTVSQPITVTMANGASSATVTITGGNPSPSTFSADGTQHTISIDSGASFTLSFSNSGNTRDGFSVSGSFSATSASYTSSTSAISLTAYEQVQNTFSVTGISGTDSVTVTGTYLGSSGATIVTLTTPTWSANNIWSDYNKAATFSAVSALSGSNERWSIGTAYTTASISSGGGSYSPTTQYYHQYYLTVTGGNGVTFGTPARFSDQWYDAGTSTTVSSNGVYSRGSGSGQRVSAWSIDGGSSTSVATVGTVTTTSVSMSASHAVTFTSVTQYQVTLDATATAALSDIVAPKISGDNYWYDSGTQVYVVLHGVWGRTGGIGNRLASGAINGVDSGISPTTDDVTIYNWYIDNHVFVTSTSKTQYQVTFTSSGLGGDATGNLATYSVSGGWHSGTSSPISVSGGSIWVDSGSTVTYSLTSTVTSSDSIKRYIKTSTDASPLTGLSGPATITGSYTAQTLDHFTVSASRSAVTSGVAISVTVTAKDSAGTTLTWYTGTVHFTSNDPSADLPGDYTFLAGDNGAHTFTNGVTLRTAGSRTITATDGSVTGTSSSITVSTALVAPTITASHSTIDRFTTSSLTATAVTTGTSPYSYQWYKKSPSDGSFSTISGATSSSYDFVTNGATASGTWTFELVVSDSCGATVTSNTEAVKVNTQSGSTMTFSYSVVGGGSGYSAPTLWYPLGGTWASYLLTSTPTAIIMDEEGYWYIIGASGTTLTGSTGAEQWVAESSQRSGNAPSTGGSATQAVTYYHQYKVTLAYSTSDGSAIPNGNQIGTYTALGSSNAINSGATYGTTSVANTWVDAGTTTTSFTTYTAGSGTERWALSTSTHNLAVTGSGTITETGYYHQIEYYIDYAISGGGSPAAPALEATQWGYDYTPTLDTSISTSYWLDSGTTWTLDQTLNPIGYPGTTERWLRPHTEPLTVSSASAGNHYTLTYTHQYKVTFEVSNNIPSDGSEPVLTVNSRTLDEDGFPYSQWYDSGSQLTFTYSNIVAAQTDSDRNNYKWSSTSGLGQTDITGTFAVNSAGTITATYILQTVTSITLSTSSTATAGTSQTVTVTVKDQYGNSMPYTGTIHFTSTDAQAILPSDYTFQNSDADTKIFTVTLKTAGSQSITATDTTVNTITGSDSVTVNPASLASIIVGVTSTSVTAGNPVAFYNMGYDQYGNALGAQSVTYTVNGITVPGASVTKTTAGTYTVSVTTAGVTITTASFTVNAGTLAYIEVQVSQPFVTAGSSVNFYTQGYDQFSNSIGSQTATFTVNGTPITGNSVTETVPGTYTVSIAGASVAVTPASFHVNAGALTSIAIAVSSTNVTAGTPVTLSATGYDQNNNSLGLQTVTFTVNGSPIQGSTVTETLVGDYSVSVTGSSVTVTAASFQINHADADHLVVASSLDSISAGENARYTVTAVDQYGNTWDVSSQAVLTINCPSGSYYWVDNSVTVTKAGQWTVTASYADQTGTALLTVMHAAVNTLTVTPASSATVAGTPVAFTATAQDSYGNSWIVSAQTSWNTNVNTGGSWSSNTYTATKTGSYTITGTYAAKSASATLTVTPAQLDHFTIASPAAAVQQTAFDITITAYDAYNNTITNYNGTVSLTASGGSINPSATGSFVNGVWTGAVTLSSPGSQTITVSSNGKTQTSQAITVNATATPTPTPAPTATVSPTPSPTAPPNSTTIIATETTTQKTYTITLNGNITASQMSNMTITPYGTNSSTVVAFTVTGESGTTGFANITLSKSAIPYGTNPVIYIDGVAAPNQGYTEDASNYYLWYTTHFSTHQITVQFKTNVPEPTATSPWLYYVLIGVALVVILFAILFATKHRKKNDENKTSKP